MNFINRQKFLFIAYEFGKTKIFKNNIKFYGDFIPQFENIPDL